MKISIFDGYLDAAELLEDDERLEFYDAIFNYAFRDIEPTLESKAVKVAWAIVKPFLDSSKNGAKHGGKGGRPPKEKGVKTPTETPTNTPNVKGVKTPPKTQYEYEREKEEEQEREREGYKTLESFVTIPDPNNGGAGADKAAPPTDELKAIFDAVDAMPGPRDMTAYSEAFGEHMAQQHPDAVPCPPGLLDAVKGVAV